MKTIHTVNCCEGCSCNLLDLALVSTRVVLHNFTDLNIINSENPALCSATEMVWIFSYPHAHSNQECVLVTQQPRMYVIYKAIEQKFQFVLIIKAN